MRTRWLPEADEEAEALNPLTQFTSADMKGTQTKLIANQSAFQTHKLFPILVLSLYISISNRNVLLCVCTMGDCVFCHFVAVPVSVD